MRKLRIYQIDVELDTHKFAFMQHSYLSQKGFINPPASIYRKVFDGDVGTDNLEEIFTMFNIKHPVGYIGHSLSVSDIVELHDGEDSEFYFCDSFGYKQVQFDKEQIQA